VLVAAAAANLLTDLALAGPGPKNQSPIREEFRKTFLVELGWLDERRRGIFAVQASKQAKKPASQPARQRICL
jgi:hypothetical protein